MCLCIYTCNIAKHSFLVTHVLMHVNIWFRFVWLTWLKGLIWELRMVGKANQHKWWFMGRGLFSSRKSKTWKQRNPIWKGGFHVEHRSCRDLAGIPPGRSEVLQLAPVPACSNSMARSSYFSRENRAEGIWAGKAAPSNGLPGTWQRTA